MGEAADAAAVGDAVGKAGGSSSGSAAGPASIASLGLSVMGSITGAQGTQAADEFQAARAERAAEFGRSQADMTDTVMRENLNTTLSNIDVIRAAAHDDPTSPTGAAVMEYNAKIADRQRNASVGSLLQQANEDTAGANYLHQAGKYALKQGYIKAGVQVASAIAKAAAAG